MSLISTEKIISQAAYSLLETAMCGKSLHSFVISAWKQIEGDNPFIDNWHIGAICEHLEAIIYGQIKKLIINVPPRTGKTSIISVMWPAWTFIRHPGIKFLFSSYAKKISLEHSRLCRMLISSPWFQKRWGNIVSLAKDQDSKEHFATTALGHRISTSVGAGGTGLGGNVLVMDDPNDAKDGESKIKREGANDWVSRTWSSRLNPGEISAQLLVAQRLHEMDVSGYLMSRDEHQEWVRLVLPMEFESIRRSKTIILPSSNGKVWQDPRVKDGELLCPGYLNEKDIKRLKIQLGSYNYAGQYQQRPAPEEGGMVERKWFRIWDKDDLPVIKEMIQSWDTASTDKEYSSNSACTTWGIFKGIGGVNNLILLHAWQGKVLYPTLLERMLRLQKNCADTEDLELEADRNFQPDKTLVEAKASGQSIIADLALKGIPIIARNLKKKYGDKAERLRKTSSLIENGLIWVVGDKYGNLKREHEEVVSTVVTFPKGESDDYVDTMTQVILYCVENGTLRHSLNIKVEDEQYPKFQRPGYEPPKRNGKRVDL